MALLPGSDFRFSRYQSVLGYHLSITTHFHGVADLADYHGFCKSNRDNGAAVQMYCTDVEEDANGGFVYVHKLRKGINRQSHALKVAKLAGMPQTAIEMARKVLALQRDEQRDPWDGQNVEIGTSESA